VGDTLTVGVTVASRDSATHRVVLDCVCTNQQGKTVISGEATVLAPTESIERPRGSLPEVRISLQQGDDAGCRRATRGPCCPSSSRGG
jgi:hypothetical protein